MNKEEIKLLSIYLEIRNHVFTGSKETMLDCYARKIVESIISNNSKDI